MIGPENSRHFLKYSDSKRNPNTTQSLPSFKQFQYLYVLWFLIEPIFVYSQHAWLANVTTQDLLQQTLARKAWVVLQKIFELTWAKNRTDFSEDAR